MSTGFPSSGSSGPPDPQLDSLREAAGKLDSNIVKQKLTGEVHEFSEADMKELKSLDARAKGGIGHGYAHVGEEAHEEAYREALYGNAIKGARKIFERVGATNPETTEKEIYRLLDSSARDGFAPIEPSRNGPGIGPAGTAVTKAASWHTEAKGEGVSKWDRLTSALGRLGKSVGLGVTDSPKGAHGPTSTKERAAANNAATQERANKNGGRHIKGP